MSDSPALALEQRRLAYALFLLRMLSTKAQTNLKNAKTYFEEHLATGDYYTEAEHVSGEWIGAGAEMLGLSGVVGQKDFVALCDNTQPLTGQRLTQRQNHIRTDNAGIDEEREAANRRVFFDFTFSPPKSVSIVALVGGDQRVMQAHREAVKIAVRELEHFASTRVRQAGSNSDRATGNIVAALFEHDSSRALDPHLHTHCIVFNATHDAQESRWKALQNYQMLVAQKYVENVYYHELARALRKCGYTVENAARGDFRVTEVSAELCERFSKRHREIDQQTREFLTANPERASGNVDDIREHLAHKLRSRKIHDLAPNRLHALWRSQLSNIEEAALQSPRATANDAETISSAAAVSWAEDHLFDRRSVVREHELWRHALEFARGSAITLDELKCETESRDYLREPDGKLTRKDVLAREWRILQMASLGVGQCSALGIIAMGKLHKLAEDQQKAFEQLIGSRDFVTLFRGGAGTGKSYVLRSVQDALVTSGRPTVVLAPQRQQVLDLERDGLTNAKTVAEFLQNKSMPDDAIVIVDEAGQIGARQTLALLELAQAHGGRVILSGDTRQHGPVEASDAMRAIERYSNLKPAELNIIRRQDPKRAKAKHEREKIQSYRKAVKAAANGDTHASFAALEKIDAIVETSPEDMHDSLVRAYLECVEKNQSALVVSQTRAEVRALNDSIRARLKATSGTAEDEQLVAALDSVDVTPAQKLDQRFYPEDHVLVFNRRVAGWDRGTRGRMIAASHAGVVVEAAGRVRVLKPQQADHLTICTPQPLQLSPTDRLQLKANAKAVGGEVLANGEVVTIRKVRASGEITLEDGRVLPASYRQFSRAYAVTSYGSQGKTVDHVLLSDSAVSAATNSQQWYVSISRGRYSVRIFTPNKALLKQHVARSGDRPLALSLDAKRAERVAIKRGLLHRLKPGRAFAAALCLLAARRTRVVPSHQESITI